MGIKKQTLEEFLNDVGSKNPTPGGGSVSAVSGAIAASLVEMVCNLTIGKKNYEKIVGSEYWDYIKKIYKKIENNIKNFKFKSK